LRTPATRRASCFFSLLDFSPFALPSSQLYLLLVFLRIPGFFQRKPNMPSAYVVVDSLLKTLKTGSSGGLSLSPRSVLFLIRSSLSIA